MQSQEREANLRKELQACAKLVDNNRVAQLEEELAEKTAELEQANQREMEVSYRHICPSLDILSFGPGEIKKKKKHPPLLLEYVFGRGQSWQMRLWSGWRVSSCMPISG